MTAPWYIYVIALLVGLPCFALWGVGAYMAGKLLVGWLLAGEPAKPGAPRISAKG